MIPTHLVFKWFPNWTRDRIRWWFETTSFAFVSGWFGIAVGGRPRYVMAMNKPSIFYRYKLKKMLRKGQISQETYNSHMLGMPYYRPPEKYEEKSSV